MYLDPSPMIPVFQSCFRIPPVTTYHWERLFGRIWIHTITYAFYFNIEIVQPEENTANSPTCSFPTNVYSGMTNASVTKQKHSISFLITRGHYTT